MIGKIRAEKGAAWLTVLIVVGVVLVVAAVVAGLTDGFGLGGGRGDGEGEGNVTEAADTEPEAAPVIEELDFLNVTVSENGYIYQNSRVELDELIERLIKDAAETRVKITDDNASKKAYEALTDALKENKISYIEAS